MPRLSNRSALTERLSIRVTPELKHRIHRVTADLKAEPMEWVRQVLDERTKQEMVGKAA